MVIEKDFARKPTPQLECVSDGAVEEDFEGIVPRAVQEMDLAALVGDAFDLLAASLAE